MDYGHPLVFGAHLTTQDPNEAIQTARLIDDLGFQYLTFGTEADDVHADHHHRSLDPWTFATYIAGNTGTLNLRAHVPDVLNPALIARSAASLDILSGGRTDISLGSESNGSAGELSDDHAALRTKIHEQLTIIKGMWDEGETLPLRFSGDLYTVPKAQRGPAPQHNVGIWIAGTTPEILQAAGELADGWTLRLSQGTDSTHAFESRVAAIDELHRQVDAAAISVGRDPREVRRQIVVKPKQIPGLAEQDLPQTAQSLLALVNAGSAEFIFETEDTATLTWLAHSVKPHIETIISATRQAAGTGIGVLRSRAILARRVGTIDYEKIPENLKKIAVEPGDSAHSRYRNTYLRGGNPGLILNARTPEHVQQAVQYAASQNVPFSLRSGGHGFSGKSTNSGGIVLNLRELRDIKVLNPDTGLVRIEPGAQWAEVAAALEPHGLAITSGDSGSVGVGGLATVGGIGFFSKEHGLTIDRVKSMDLVTADGRLIHTSATENPELFWGMRGAGPNFGVVTAFEIEAHKTGTIAHVQLTFAVEDVAQFFEQYGKLVEETPEDTTLFLMAGRAQYGQPTNVMLYGIVDSDDQDLILERLQPFAYLSPLVAQQVYLTTYAGAIGAPASSTQRGQGEPISRAGALPHLTKEISQGLARLLRSDVTSFFQIRTTGGVASAIPEDSTAFSGRSDIFHVLMMGNDRNRLNMVWDSMEELSNNYYLNFDTDIRPERVQAAFSPEKWERLVALKREWDPTNLFKDNFNILP